MMVAQRQLIPYLPHPLADYLRRVLYIFKRACDYMGEHAVRTPGYCGLQGFAELVIQNKIKLKFFSAKLVIGFVKFRYALTPGRANSIHAARTSTSLCSYAWLLEQN